MRASQLLLHRHVIRRHGWWRILLFLDDLHGVQQACRLACPVIHGMLGVSESILSRYTGTTLNTAGVIADTAWVAAAMEHALL